MTTHNVLLIPKLTVNVVSLIKLEGKGVRYSVDNGIRSFKINSSTLGRLNILSNLKLLELVSNRCALSTKNHSHSTQDCQDIHSSPGQLSYDKTKHLKININLGFDYPCDVCNATKSTRNASRRKFRNPHRHLYELIYSDICEVPII